MKIGLFFGTFNPIHIGHLIIAQAALNQAGLDKI
ncbi:MAG TPA: adenylyltransferase/cytidyltransferase family protein, partial [Catalimonadaceae bacterium]|nr:adenylyltransferase/cytidyltransferase family protein [Catalimonadaceae bacterium]